MIKNSLSSADAIVVLAGGNGKRLIKGISLFYENFSPLIIMSGGSGNILIRVEKVHF